MSVPQNSSGVLATQTAGTLRVLHVHSGNLFGGVETMMLTHVRHQDLCPALQSSFALCFAGRFSEELVSAGASVYQLGGVRISRPLSVRRARRNLRDLLRRKTFDVVVTHSSWSQAVFGPAVRAAAVPLVSYLHAPPYGRHWLERLARRTLPDLAICNSEFTRAGFSHSYPDVRSEIVYCPVAPGKEAYSASELKLIRVELETPPDATVIIQVGRMERLKGHLLHLEALRLLRDVPGWICWQVGGAQRPGEIQYLEEVKTQAKRLEVFDRLRFLDERADVRKLLAASNIYCQPNTSPESFGITFVEALYAGLPVITTALGGACEIVDDLCGILVPSADPESIAAALRRLIQGPSLRVSLGSAGPSRARLLCDPAAQINRFHLALASVTQGQRAVTAI